MLTAVFCTTSYVNFSYLALCVCALIFCAIVDTFPQGCYPLLLVKTAPYLFTLGKSRCTRLHFLLAYATLLSMGSNSGLKFGLSSYCVYFEYFALPIHPELSSPTTSFFPPWEFGAQDQSAKGACAPYPGCSARIEVGLDGPESRAPARTFMMRSLLMTVYSALS